MFLLPTPRHELNRQYPSLFDDLAARILSASFPTTKQFKANIKEVEGGYELTAELPGFAKNEVDVSIEEDRVVISATKETSKEEEGNWLLFEHSTNSVVRTFKLPEFIDKEKTEATYRNGILTIKLATTLNKPSSHIAIK